MLGLCWATTGCGGGAPLLHPAHTLPTSQITLGAGVSGNFVLHEARDDIDAAVAAAPQPGTAVSADQEDVLFRGFLAQTYFSPGVAPWVGARAGLGHQLDAGATYTGRSARVDARHALEQDAWALSFGLGASGHLMRPGSYAPEQQGDMLVGQVEASGEIPGFSEVAVTGWGLDLPVLGGWRSRASLVQIWTGARGGVERLWGDVAWQSTPNEIQEAQVGGFRWFVGGLVGLAVGIDPVWGTLELDVAYQGADASLDWIFQGDGHSYSAKLQAVGLSPAAALVGKF